jgi:hypothetical protein
VASRAGKPPGVSKEERQMTHIVGENAAEWDVRVQRELDRRKRLARRTHIGMSVAGLIGLVALALTFTLEAEKPPAVAAPSHPPAKAADAAFLRIPLDVSFNHKAEADELEGQVQRLAVGLARIWRSGKSEEAAKTADSFAEEYERAAGCDLRWIAGRAGPGVWDGTFSLVRSLRQITPYVGRAREGQAVVVTAITCPLERETPRPAQ